MNILLIVDNKNFGSELMGFLQSNDFEVTLCATGKEGVLAFQNNSFDLCILDLQIPGMDGFMIAFEIRQMGGNVPIIFLTANSLKEDLLKKFNMEADDYIIKPVDTNVLLTKIKEILIRTDDEKTQLNNQDEFTFGKFHLNYKLRTLSIDGKKTRLTRIENDLLRLFLIYLNEILPREKALLTIWGQNDHYTSRSMDVYITKLRKILKDDPSIEIINIHGQGYRMVDGKE